MTRQVVVIGGGPAGLAAAIALGRRGVPTVLVERRMLPADKACGEGLLPNGVRALEELGIDRASLDALGHPIVGVRYYGPSGAQAEGRFRTGRGVGLKRTHLSALLLDQARRWPSIEIVTGVAAHLEPNASGHDVSIPGRRFSPWLVVGADGLGSRTRGNAGIGSGVGQSPRWGMRQHVNVSAWSDMVEVHFGRGFEIYITPLDRGINVAVLWDPTLVQIPGGTAGPVLDTAVRIPRLAERFAGATTLSPVAAAGPFARHVAGRAKDGLVLVGDAGGYLDALTGEGVGLALHQAVLLGQHVAPLLDRADTSGPIAAADLAPFVRSVNEAGRPNRDLTRLMLLVARKPRLVEWVIRRLRSRPALLEHALGANVGAHGLWRW